MAKPSSLVSQKLSDSGLRIQLHPLVLLTISDHITRHAARSQPGPTIGALLGQQIGREITLEHVFECNLISGPHDELLLPQPWFDERLKQFKDVHKVPALDLVGWWSTASPTGPDASHLPIHKQILQDYNESAVFLAFHPSQLEASSANNGKLPLTVYESVYEGGDHAGERDKAAMQLDGEEQTVSIRFRELPYTIETGEAEMISIESVARGGGNAAVSGVTSGGSGVATTDAAGDAKPQAQTDSTTEQKAPRTGAGVGVLTSEEEDLIASLRTRVNAIKTLESRVSLIKSYVSTLSASVGNDGMQAEAPDHATNLPLSHPILRDINSLISHLALLTPSSQSDFTAEIFAQTNDVLLVTLLGQLGQSVKAMRELGRKSSIVQNTKQNSAVRKAHPSAAAAAATAAAMHSRLDEEEYLAARDRDGGLSTGGGGGGGGAGIFSSRR